MRALALGITEVVKHLKQKYDMAKAEFSSNAMKHGYKKTPLVFSDNELALRAICKGGDRKGL